MRKFAKKSLLHLQISVVDILAPQRLERKKKTVLIVVLGSNVAKEQLIYPLLEI